MQKTKREIIEETANFYHLGNRGYSAHTLDCVYLDFQTRNRCALGRCFDAPDETLYDLTGTVDRDGCILMAGKPSERWIDIETLLKKEYRGHSPDFWNDLQSLHDGEKNWTNDGLSERGKQKIENLLNNWVKN
jgi:hypothetical protein